MHSMDNKQAAVVGSWIGRETGSVLGPVDQPLRFSIFPFPQAGGRAILDTSTRPRLAAQRWQGHFAIMNQ
jgi:hypothetical protein